MNRLSKEEFILAILLLGLNQEGDDSEDILAMLGEWQDYVNQTDEEFIQDLHNEFKVVIDKYLPYLEQLHINLLKNFEGVNSNHVH